jgi:NHLM bacteriocin system ABC transporter peptidase/ATP-binding protein
MATTMEAPPEPKVEGPSGSTKRVNVPTVLQMEVTECGAASLGMVLAHYGKWVPLEELRDTCGASRDGTTMADLLKAARHYGLDGHGSYLRASKLDKNGYPIILFYKGAHFVVLEGLVDGGAWLNDPAIGPRFVTTEELESDYAKVCLILRPSEEFEPGGTKPRPWRGVLQRATKAMNELIAVVLLGLMATVPGLAVAAISKMFLDDVLIAGKRSAAFSLIVGLLAVIVLQTLITWYQQRVLIKAAIGLTVVDSSTFVHKALRLPEKYFVARSVADLSQRVQHNRDVVSLLTGRLAIVSVGAIVVVVYAVAMIIVDPLLAAIALALTLCNLIALRTALKRRRDASRLLVQQQAMLQQTTAYGAITLESIKAGGLEGDYYARWEGTAVRVADVRQEIAVKTQVGNAVPTLLRALTSAAVLGVGALQVISGSLEIGSLVAFQVLVGYFQGPIGDLVGFAWMMQQVQNLVKRLDDVLDEKIDPSCDPEIQRFGLDEDEETRLQGAISMRNVSFGFKSTAEPLISNFSIDVPPGARVAVVGTSGSGKSTLVRLLAGLYEPWEGEVRFDGLRREDIPRPVISRSIAMVDQRIALFSGTVRENLTLWDPSVPEEDMVRAASDAQIHDAISARVGSYSAQVADGGANWSGGQRQRLEIARALVRNPSILLLDEATSALDTETEAEVDAALQRRGCTTIVVAHRLSTVRDADLILVMSTGKVVEMGRHDELMALDGVYAKLVQE